jgi:hypothetical protein
LLGIGEEKAEYTRLVENMIEPAKDKNEVTFSITFKQPDPQYKELQLLITTNSP